MHYVVLGMLQAVLTKLLKRNKLTGKDVDAVELLGGGSRVPMLQSVLTDALGGRYEEGDSGCLSPAPSCTCC
jgi:molecular chaperone DnaK (HSP70)